MAGWFTHLLIAQRALEKLPKSKHKLISGFAQFDDYLFGSIAPDVRYVQKVNRDISHEPFGKESAFQAFNLSNPFVRIKKTLKIIYKNRRFKCAKV